jgi:glycosyltransferase involved in cell wall biosynthesis
VIAMSDFNAAYFQRILPPTVKVAKLLYPFRFSPPTLPPPAQTRRRFGIGVNDFAVFFNFDYGSSFFRKNPDGAIRAFAKAFRDTPDAKLVFKTNRAKDFPKAHASLRDLAATLGIADQFISIDDFLKRDDVYAITAASNIYLSLHRGEGFGLGIAEAMSLGKPAIVTDYGGSTEFCIPETAILIPYSKRTLHHGQMDNPCYHDVDFCAEPDIDSAAKAMRRCYESREICLDIGLRAKRFVEAHFSAEQFRKSLAALMKGFRVDG